MIATSEAKVTKLIRQSPAALGISVLALGAITARAQLPSNYVPPEILQHVLEPRESLMHLGMFNLNPHAAGSVVYDSDITLQAKRNQDDYIVVFSPGLDLFKAGERGAEESATQLRASYDPALLFFTQHDKFNSVDHYAALTAGIQFARLSADISQDFQSSSGGTMVDVTTRVHQNFSRTGARMRYEVSDKTSAEISGSYRITDYDKLIDSEEWTEDNALKYQITPKVSLGFGVSVGQLKVGRTPDALTNAAVRASNGDVQTYVTPGLRAGYKTTERTDVSLAVGGEWRHFEDESSSFGPVFSLTGTYRPTEATELSLEAHRRQQNSAVLGGQNFIATGMGFHVGQRWRERYRGSLNFSYDNGEYESAKHGVSANRVSDYFLLRYGVDMKIDGSWTVGVFHQYRLNTGNSRFDFDNHQINIQTIWSY